LQVCPLHVAAGPRCAQGVSRRKELRLHLHVVRDQWLQVIIIIIVITIIIRVLLLR
jgi:hypothetical protein